MGCRSATRWGTLSIAQDGANDEPLIAGHTPRGRRGVTRQSQPSFGIIRSDGRVPRAHISAFKATRAPFSRLSYFPYKKASYGCTYSSVSGKCVGPQGLLCCSLRPFRYLTQFLFVLVILSTPHYCQMQCSGCPKRPSDSKSQYVYPFLGKVPFGDASYLENQNGSD